MEPAQWLAAFRVLHEKVKRGTAPLEERARYQALRNELATSLVAAQGMAVPPGQEARKHFRVAQVLKIEINKLYRTTTRDVSRAGFAVNLEGVLAEKERVSFALTLAAGQEPVSGEARVVSVIRSGGVVRASFAIEKMAEADAERLEMALFDAVLARLK